MTVKRNVDGLRQNAQRKRQETADKVEKGIQQLLKQNRPITFNAVAESSGVSKAWLYKEPEIKSRIEHLRSQSPSSNKQLPPKQRASDASKDAIVRTLKERVKTLESENRELRKQNEIAYGQVLRIRDLEREVRYLKSQSEHLKPQAHDTHQKSGLSDLENQLLALGVELNSTLLRLIREAPQDIVETAIDALKEAVKASKVHNLGGFLNKAITDAWKPNAPFQPLAETEEFSKWWDWAYGKGFVKAATQLDGVQHVLTANEEWIPFAAARKTFGDTNRSENRSV